MKFDGERPLLIKLLAQKVFDNVTDKFGDNSKVPFISIDDFIEVADVCGVNHALEIAHY